MTDTTTIEITDSQRDYLRDLPGRSAKDSLQVLIDAHEGTGELSEDRVREIVRDMVVIGALE